MRDDAGGEKGLAMRVEVESPGIAGAFCKDIELFGGIIVAPDRGVHLNVADLGMREDAVQSVEQTVRSPLKRVKHLMRILATEATQQDFVLVAVAAVFGVLQEQEVRRR